MKNLWSATIVLIVQILFCLQRRQLITEALAISVQQNRGSNQNPDPSNDNKKHIEFMPEQDSFTDSEFAGGDGMMFGGGIPMNVKDISPLQISNNIVPAELYGVNKRIPSFENRNEAIFSNKKDFKRTGSFQDTRSMNSGILSLPGKRSFNDRVLSIDNSFQPLDRRQVSSNNALHLNQIALQNGADIDHPSYRNLQQPENVPMLSAPPESPDETENLKRNIYRSPLKAQPMFGAFPDSSPVQTDNVKRNIYPGGVKTQSQYSAAHVHDLKFDDYRNAQRGTLYSKDSEVSNVRRYQNGANFKNPGDGSDGLERSLKYVQSEVREDVFGPKEWNSTRIIQQNVQFPLNSGKRPGGRDYGLDAGDGTNVDGQAYPLDAYQRYRGIRKRNLHYTTTGSTARARRKSKHIVFITQDSNFGEDAETVTSSESSFRKAGSRIRPVSGEEKESYVTEMTHTLDEEQQPEKANSHKSDKNNKISHIPNRLSDDKKTNYATTSHLHPPHENPPEILNSQSAVNRSKNNSVFNGSDDPGKQYDISDVSHQIHDFGSMIKNNLSNILRMNFDLGVPDNNFKLRVERKDLEIHKGSFRNTKSDNLGGPKRHFKPRRPFRAKQDYSVPAERRGRHIRSLTKHPESSRAVKNPQPLNRSNKTTSKHSEDNSKRAFSKEGGSKAKKSATNTTKRLKFAYKILARIPTTKSTHALTNISTSKAVISQAKRGGWNSTPIRFHPQRETLDFGPTHNQTNASETGNGLDSEHRRLVLRLVNDLSPEDSQALLKLMDSNASSLYNDSNIEFEGSNAIYLLNISALANSSMPRDTRILNMLRKSNMWDNVHYVEERAIQEGAKSQECCQDVLSVVRRNPFTVALTLAVLCVVIVVMLVGVFFMAERRFKKKREALAAAKKYLDYKIIKHKKRVGYGEVVDDPDEPQTPPKRDTEESEPEKDTEQSPRRRFHRPWGKRDTSSENKDREKQKLLPRKKFGRRKKGEKKEVGLVNRARRWVRRKMSMAPESETGEEATEEEATEREYISESSSDTDETYFSKRERLKRYVKKRGAHKKRSFQKPKVVAPDLRTTLKEVQLYLSEDQVSPTSLQGVHAELKQRITTTGDCDQIDHMLVRDEWERALYTTHGLDKIMEDQDLTDYSPEERRKLNIEKIEELSALSGGGLGILSKGSSAHSLKSEVGRSMNTAEWVNKHPRPVSNKVLKSKYRK